MCISHSLSQGRLTADRSHFTFCSGTLLGTQCRGTGERAGLRKDLQIATEEPTGVLRQEWYWDSETVKQSCITLASFLCLHSLPLPSLSQHTVEEPETTLQAEKEAENERQYGLCPLFRCQLPVWDYCQWKKWKRFHSQSSLALGALIWNWDSSELEWTQRLSLTKNDYKVMESRECPTSSRRKICPKVHILNGNWERKIKLIFIILPICVRSAKQDILVLCLSFISYMVSVEKLFSFKHFIIQKSVISGRWEGRRRCKVTLHETTLTWYQNLIQKLVHPQNWTIQIKLF
jgi:hypothetical protein